MGDAVASAAGEAVAQAAGNGVTQAIVSSIAEALATDGAQAFAESLAQAVAEGDCTAVADAVTQAQAIGGGAVADAASQVQAVCSNPVPTVKDTLVDCGRFPIRCVGPATSCCIESILEVGVDEVCEAGITSYQYKGVCESDNSKVYLEPSFGIKCTCQA
eukprot:TRINITY_DN117_c0_g1_i14.p2 TRINITY_DN117_c0_g1~~TRINITY_DN117_c0_g1_i14.p2  ORF type:complete len:178 (-),score=36.16 TRINITY_DN117_c0_g1_i14:192-671(-)